MNEQLLGRHGAGVWNARDFTGDGAILDRAAAAAHPQVVGFLVTSGSGVYLTRTAVATLRDACDQLLAGQPDPGTALPSFRELQRVAAAVADNVDSIRETTAARAREFACRDAGWLAVDVQALAIEVRGLARVIAGEAS